MLTLLATLIVTYLRLGTGKTEVSPGETWAVRLPFSIYLGWITVATVANITDVLDYLKWNGFGIAPETWMLIVLGAVFVIATLMSLTHRDVAYALVVVWALIGIYVKQVDVLQVASAAAWTAAFVAATLALGLFLLRPKQVKMA
jgi:benzodiazapine receptor